MILVETANKIFSLFTIAGQILILFFVFLLVFKKKNYFFDLVGKYFLWIVFVLSLAASLGSLFYSNIIGYTPCNFCWFQRIFMYPLVIISGLSIWNKDERAADYILTLSFLGALVAGYQYLLQMGVLAAGSCSIVGNGVECSKIYLLEFGYITMPLMSLTAFLLIAFSAIINKISPRNGK